MHTIAPQWRRDWMLGLFVAALLALTACTTYVVLPGDVGYEKVSPPYVLTVENATGQALTVAPSAFGRVKGYAPLAVPAGATFDLLVQVRRFRIGKDDRVGGHQVGGDLQRVVAGDDGAG